MKIRRDAVFVSSLLFTVPLLALIPHNLRYASTWSDRFFPANQATMENQFAPIGFASLAVVFIGLIVIWTGYVNKVRWTWFVMFVIVWIFAFPVYVLPVVMDIHAGAIDWTLFWNAMRESGPARAVAKGPLDFLGMLVALLLPARTFFQSRIAP
jgi:hypothetical protein